VESASFVDESAGPPVAGESPTQAAS